MKNLLLSYLMIVCFIVSQTFAQSLGDYRSKGSGNWNSSSTWQRYNGTDWVDAPPVPTNSDGVITIKVGHTVTVNDSRTADQVVVEAGATLDITNYTFTIADGTGVDLKVDGTLNLSTNISGTGSIEINGTMNWTAGNMSSGGTTTISSGATLTISGGSNKTIENGRNLINYGTIYWTGGDIYFYATAILTNQIGGNFFIQTDYTIKNNLGGGTKKIDNYGTIIKNTATGTTNSQIEINNHGNLIVNSGTLTLNGGGTHSSSMTVAGGCTLNFAQYTNTIGENVTLGGGGTYQFTDHTLTLTGTTNGAFIEYGTTFNFNSGTINGDGHLTVYGVMNWTGGSMEGTGTTTISSPGSLTISGGNNKTLANGRNLVNTGTITWTGGNIYFYATAILTNQIGGIFYIQTDYTIINNFGGGTKKIDNYGTLIKNTTTGTTTSQIEVNNFGTISVYTGTLNLSYLSNFSSGTLSGGKFNIYSASLKYGSTSNISTLSAELTLNGNSSQILNSSGTDALASLSTISSSGKLTFENGRNYSVNVSTLTNNGTTKLDGSYLTIPSSYSFVNNGNLIFNNYATILGAGNFSTNSSSTLEIDNTSGISSSDATGNIQNTGTREFSTSANYTYKGSLAQITGSGLPATVNNLTINNSHTSGVTLTNDLTVNGTLTLSNGDLALNGKTITLGNTANLVETPGNTITGTTGKITTTRTFSAGDLSSGVNIAGLGAKVTTEAELGTTIIERMHSQAIGGGNSGISRIYRILPTNNDGLNATLEFYYDESELSGINESDLRLFQSTDGSENSWILRGGTVNTDENIVTLSGINEFSYWTLGNVNNPLPVEITQCIASVVGNSVVLEWRTATEVNNYGFEIERRNVGFAEWEKIGFVQGAGTSNSPKEYSFTDANLPSGRYEYRLKQIDLDGTFKYSQSVEVEVAVPQEFALHQNYPNPFNPTTVISYALPVEGMVTLKVYDALGKEVATLVNEHQGAGNYEVTFDASHLASGVYFYALQTGMYRSVKKFVLMK